MLRLLAILLLSVTLHAKTIVKYRGSANPDGGTGTAQHYYEVTQNKHTTYYRFTIGHFNTTITNLTTQTSHNFAMFTEGGDA